ncbi:hypothetical protein CRG98_022062 [Punica granatum]|uniref:Uncharacterized protein n=1 Tax=Punica granatum TaxID=22663 RepID=A0A2I0JMT3_PUNGR|nr:hypothetical protein CRG98_022062 [Punica granatum]
MAGMVRLDPSGRPKSFLPESGRFGSGCLLLHPTPSPSSMSCKISLLLTHHRCPSLSVLSGDPRNCQTIPTILFPPRTKHVMIEFHVIMFLPFILPNNSDAKSRSLALRYPTITEFHETTSHLGIASNTFRAQSTNAPCDEYIEIMFQCKSSNHDVVSTQIGGRGAPAGDHTPRPGSQRGMIPPATPIVGWCGRRSSQARLVISSMKPQSQRRHFGSGGTCGTNTSQVVHVELHLVQIVPEQSPSSSLAREQRYEVVSAAKEIEEAIKVGDKVVLEAHPEDERVLGDEVDEGFADNVILGEEILLS